jgi:hypothetical protein
METLYDILEVSPNASPETIRAAYKSLVIAAAPELLGACRGFVEHFGYIGFDDDAFAFNHLQAARAAIAKAEGEQP